MKLTEFLTSKRFSTFATGAVAGLLFVPALKSKTARRAAVCVTAKGLQFKDDAAATFTSIKEDAQDVYAEAKQKNAPVDTAAQ